MLKVIFILYLLFAGKIKSKIIQNVLGHNDSVSVTHWVSFSYFPMFLGKLLSVVLNKLKQIKNIFLRIQLESNRSVLDFFICMKWDI